MSRKQLLVKSSNQWLFGNKPTDRQLVDSGHYVLGLGDISKIPTVDVFDKFFTNAIEERQYEGMDILRMIAEPAFIWMAAKILFGITLHPLQAAVYSEIYNRPFPLLCGSRGFAKSFGLAFILGLKAALTVPLSRGGTGFQAIVVGSGFRQSKIIFSYLERMWNSANILKSICGPGDGIKKEQDRFSIVINGNTIMFIPLGDGHKIRGMRCLSKDTIVETDQGLVRIQDFDKFGDRKLVTGDENIPLEKPSMFLQTNLADVYEVEMEYGMKMKCSEYHQVMTQDGWKFGKDLTENDYIESKNYYQFPKCSDTDPVLIKVLGKHYKIHKKVPESILLGTVNNILTYLSAIFGALPYAGLKCNSQEEQTIRDIQLLLWKMGYVSKIEYDDSQWWLSILGNKCPDYIKVQGVTKLLQQEILYDYTLPETHSFYANGLRNHNCSCLAVDEKDAVNPEIFETVVQGFGAVATDPIGNIEYFEKMRYLRSIKSFDELKELKETFTVHRNQTIIMGTAGYHFRPFYKDYRRYKLFIESKGDINYLRQNGMTDEEIPDDFNYQDYSICHIPYSLIKQVAPGFMDEATVSRSKATMNVDLYNQEYEAIFTKDSIGFFKASVINKNTEHYRIGRTGDNIGENMCLGHVFGIDVASEYDKFAITVLGIYPNHAKVVNVWSTNRKSFEARQLAQETEMSEYYSFCVRKVRELIQCYPPLMSHPTGAYIACDIGGGGVAIREAFHDLDKLRDNESPIYEVIDAQERKMTDNLEGEHCLKMINFTSSATRDDIYHGGNKTLQDGRVKFPFWDQIAMEQAMDADETQRQKYMESNLADNELIIYDTLEDTFLEIQRMIDELCSIKGTGTPSGGIQFKAESKKNSEGKTVYMHKDRATSFLLALVLYRSYYMMVDPALALTAGGIVKPKGRRGEFFQPISPLAIQLNKTMLACQNANKMLRGESIPHPK